MKRVEMVRFVSEVDGQEFETEEECLKQELLQFWLWKIERIPGVAMSSYVEPVDILTFISDNTQGLKKAQETQEFLDFLAGKR